ncbi:hypothetical protein JTB14_003147 [Gonioctena quinquepunctata]|nr:hypothetical protein JTB14_003147 [Gonioctena quinquepunctata]
MAYTEEHIKNKLEKELEASHVEVVDESDGCGGKFSCLIVSEKFKGKPLLQRHRLVNSILEEELKTIHAFSQKTFTPEHIKNSGSSVQVSTPGKVILHGEHSVVYGKLALAASLGLRTKLTISEIDSSDTLVVKFSNWDLIKTYSLQTIKEHLLDPALPLIQPAKDFNLEHPDLIHHETLLDKVDNFLKATGTTDLNPAQLVATTSLFYLLAGILGSVDIELVSISIEVSTQLDIGAGTGSSASYLVSSSAAFLQYVKLKKKSENFSKVEYKPSSWDVNLSKFSNKELDIICSWAYCAEKIVHGTPSGLDNTICTYGSIVEFRKGLSPKLLDITYPFKLLLINTKVPRETKQLVSKVAQLHKKHPELVNNILNSMEDVAFIALQNIIALSQLEVISDCSDLQTDIQGHFDELCQLSSINHNLLGALGVSHVKLDEAVHLLAQHGLHGKLTGAGGGGYAICLVPPGTDSGVLDGAMKDLVYKGFGVVCTELGGEGVKVESVV